MRYRIADEIVQYESQCDEIKRLFEKYRFSDTSIIVNEILLNKDGLCEFRKRHSNLSIEQSEMIYLLQLFFL